VQIKLLLFTFYLNGRLHACTKVVKIARLSSCKNFVSVREKFIFEFCCLTDAENDTTSPVLLLLYEFEAKARLGDSDAERVLDRAICLPQAEPKLFEAIAGNLILVPVCITIQIL